MNNPFFSILISCYNPNDYIYRALQSCKNQTFKDYEILLCDNCSKDGTIQILKDIKTDNFKYFLSKERQNSISVRNFLIKQAKGKYIIWLDLFDELQPSFLQYVHDVLHKKDYDLMEFNLRIKHNDQKFQVSYIEQFEYENDNCLETYMKRNDFAQDFLYGKVIKAQVMKKCIVPEYDTVVFEQPFYMMMIYYYAKTYLSDNTFCAYTYYADLDHFHSEIMLNEKSFVNLIRMKQELLKRNIDFLKNHNLFDKYKQYCFNKLFLNKMFEDIIQIENNDERYNVFSEFFKYFNVKISSDLME